MMWLMQRREVAMRWLDSKRRDERRRMMMVGKGGGTAGGWSSLSGRKPLMKNRPMQAPAGLVTSSAE